MRLPAAGLACVLALGAAGAGATEWTLTAGASHPPTVPWVRAIRDHVVPQSNRMLEELGAPDRIVWTEAYGGTLYNFRDTLEGVGGRLADIGWVATLWEPVKLPLENVTLPRAPSRPADVHLLAELREALHRAVPAMGAAWLAHGAVWLGGQIADSYQIVARAPLASVAALGGLKVLAVGPRRRLARGHRGHAGRRAAAGVSRHAGGRRGGRGDRGGQRHPAVQTARGRAACRPGRSRRADRGRAGDEPRDLERPCRCT